MGIVIGSNIDYYSRNFLDSRQSCKNYTSLVENKNNIQYPQGFIVYCIEDNKYYQNIAKNNETPSWKEYGISKAYVYQEQEPDNTNLMWCKPGESIERINNEFTTDELVALVKNYKSVTDALVLIVEQLQKEVENIKKNGVIVEPSNPSDTGTDGGIVTETGAYLVTETGAYLVIK